MPERTIQDIEIDRRSVLSVFTQSKFWGDFQKELGKKVYEFSGAGWSALCIEQKVPTGTYWLLPYGPYALNKSALDRAITKVSAEAKKAECLWVRIEPRISIFKTNNARKSPRDVDPSNTTMLDLRVDQEVLLRRLAKTNKQRINRQYRDQKLCFWTSTDPADISSFSAMQGVVSGRTGASFYKKDYLLTQAKVLMPLGVMRIEFAGLKRGSPIAGAIIHDYNQTATYTYAASYPEARGLGAANLLIWHAILGAKDRGNITFDFWGVAPRSAKNTHPWQGFSDFKRSFGTQDVSFAGTWDLPLSRQYFVYSARAKMLTTLKGIKQRVRNRSKNSYR